MGKQEKSIEQQRLDAQKELDAEYGWLDQATPRDIQIMESLRFRDQDQSTKLGAMLGFTGLMVATIVVQLSAASDAPIGVSKHPSIVFLLLVSVVVLIVGASIVLASLTSTGKYDNSMQLGNRQFSMYIAGKVRACRIASIFVTIGTLVVLACLCMSAFSNQSSASLLNQLGL